jgi:Na+-transporting NADH:ubiquinone oxidoreductase subunit NqrC
MENDHYSCEGKDYGVGYGYISLKTDMNTIYGTNFDHEGDSGLGARSIQHPLRSVPGRNY